MTIILDQPLAHNPWVANSARIVDIRPEVPDVSTYDLVFDNPEVAETYRFEPGQFNMLYLPGFGESAISISSNPSNRDSLSHTVRVAGNVTQALARKKSATTLACAARSVRVGPPTLAAVAISSLPVAALGWRRCGRQFTRF